MHAYARMRMYLYNIYIYIIYLLIYLFIYLLIYLFIYLFIIYMNMHTHIYINVCVHTHMNIYIYTHGHVNTICMYMCNSIFDSILCISTCIQATCRSVYGHGHHGNGVLATGIWRPHGHTCRAQCGPEPALTWGRSWSQTARLHPQPTP